MSVSTLRADALVKRFKKRTVVREVSLRIEAGEIVGLLGPNGAGKTTSFYMIVGLIAADSGRIELNGRDITRLPMHARARLGIGYLPQEASVFRTLSVEDNIKAILELRDDLKRPERKRELERLLEELHIAHIRDAEGQALSGGERRRVEIARALAANPHFILLDEPFAGVDPIAVGDIQGIVRQLSERGIGVLITDHNVRETLGICCRAYILAEGRVIADGKPDALLHDETVRKVYLGDSFKL
ncbi:MAG: LPS export ABC transporter ATP-binding protein [Sinimarinibacterium flocculans]|uniref:Lipopolysaccharide export system ATP-binding protein LptB n=1 Tax=Sinimarinibacterium flocculans TaxID=985250 RepID=A0A318EBS1_9GAMM|nr:LPS export ABC transporter ATP-binding protein [Sinimarinibacterium flocculans]MEC9363315.1 LPS export ABC transporter ATP-binding protein [Pseudomonadota bacterium]PXV69552.1 lipopolysaccharide export system ATP-binding protein [Sinimarinibacterium flocculans]